MKAQKTLQFPWVPRWHLPRLPKNWWQILIAGTILVLVMAVMVKEISNPSPPPPAPLPELTASGPIVPATVPVIPIATPATPTTWPLMQVEWSEIAPTPGVYLLNPIQGNGFYTGTMNRPKISLEEAYAVQAYVKQHFPQFKDGAYLAVARTADIVFVSIMLSGGGSHLFLSVDGEKSWQELNLPSFYTLAVGSGAVRVSAEGEFIRLIARDNLVREKWWTTTITKSPPKV